MTSSKRIHKEISEIESGISNGTITFLRNLEMNEADFYNFKITILPYKEPFNSGAFKLTISYPADYPFKPMQIKFVSLAGFLLAVKDGGVNPELLSWHESGAVLLMIILGGIGSLRGAVIGAAAFTLLKELFQSEALLGSIAGNWQLTLGLTIIAFVAWLPRGLIGLARRGAGHG